MSSCIVEPTSTSTELITTTSQSVTRSTVTTEGPESTRTSLITSCVLTASASGTVAPACLSSTVITSLTTIPGGPVITDVPVTVDVPVTLTSFETLFGTTCTSISSDPPSQPPPTPPTTTQPPPTPQSPSVSISTPPPQTFTSQSETTLPNGVVTVTSVIIVSSPPPVSVTEPVTAPPGGQTQQSDDGGSNSTNMGPIIGGAVGGFFGLLGIVAVIWFIMKRRSRWDDIFEKEEEEQGRARHDGRFSLDVDNEPKPYQYGLVGHVPSPSVQSPPNSPPLGPTTMNHNRRPSATGMPAPLSLSPSFTTSGHSAPQSGANLSRPSSAGSTQPLWSAGQQMGRSTNDFGTRPPSMHSHSHSSSITSPPTSFANWGNTGNVTGTGAFMGAALGGAAAAAISDPVPHRSGSPVSMQEPPRRLQLANATPPSSIYSPEHDHHRGISNDSMTRVAPTHVAEFDPYSVSSIDTPLVQGHPGVTRTNTKGIVILDPPQREVRVAQDGGRILMASTSAASGSGSSSAGPSTSQAQSSSSASASASTSAPRPETRQTVSDPPSQGSSSQSQSQGLPTAPPAYEE